MASQTMQKMLDAAHAPAARAKAMKTLQHLTALRQKMAAKHGIASAYFTKGHLIKTCKRMNIPLWTIPEELFHPFPRQERMAILAQRKASKGNGAAHPGSSIPLDAIPERKGRGGHREPKKLNLNDIGAVAHRLSVIDRKIKRLKPMQDERKRLANRLLSLVKVTAGS